MMRGLLVLMTALGCSGDIGGQGLPDASPPALDAAVCPDGWGDCELRARQPLTVDFSAGTETLEDVPLLVVLSDDRADAGALSAASLRFYDHMGDLLDHEVEELPTGAGLAAWVRIPVLEAGSQPVITAYYGSDSATSSAQPSAVWSASYAGVWHLSQDPSAQILDSTSSANHGSSNGEMTAASLVSGRVGSALLFDGVDDFVQIPDSDSVDITGTTLTLSAWVHLSNLPIADTGVIVKSDASQYNYQLGVEEEDVGNFRVRTDIPVDPDINPNDNLSRIDTESLLTTDGWLYLVGVFDTDSTTIYLNGNAETSEAHDGNILSAGGEPLLLGRRALGDERYFDGIIDEARVATVARSSEWIAFQHRSGRDQVVTYGPVETW